MSTSTTLQILVGLLLELLYSMALQQHVSKATHMGGHTLDLVISRDGCDTIGPGSVVISDMVFDHSSVHSVLDLEPPPPVKRICKYCRLGAIDRAAFWDDLQHFLFWLIQRRKLVT